MKIICPAGIGDFSWMWSKLIHVKNEIHAWRVIDGAPRRTVPYVKLCGIENVDYDVDREGELATCGNNYQAILVIENALKIDAGSRPTWEKIRKITKGTGAVLPLEANQHLENGWPLAEWLPDLPTDYHYPLYVSDAERESSRKKTIGAMTGDPTLLSPPKEGSRMALIDRWFRRVSPPVVYRSLPHPMKEGPIVGISCASYKGAEAWLTWGREEWVDFLKRVMDLGWRPLLVGGGWDDLTYAVACELELPSTVGRSSVAEMVEQMSHLDSYIGFSSGMNVIRTVLNKPAMALWPANGRCDQSRLMWSWAPPHMIEEGRYQAVTWRPVDDIWPVAKQFLRRCEKEIGA